MYCNLFSFYKKLVNPDLKINAAVISELALNKDCYDKLNYKEFRTYVVEVIISYVNYTIIKKYAEVRKWIQINEKKHTSDLNHVLEYLIQLEGNNKHTVSVRNIKKWLHQRKPFKTISDELYKLMFGVTDDTLAKKLIPCPIMCVPIQQTTLSFPHVMLLNSMLSNPVSRWFLKFSHDPCNRKCWEEFYQAVHGIAGTFIIIQNTIGNVFGIYGAKKWFENDVHPGSKESFVFTLEPNVFIYQTNSKLKHQQYLNDCGFGLRKWDGEFALYICSSLKRGRSPVQCAAFDNFRPLSEEMDFTISKIEVWIKDNGTEALDLFEQTKICDTYKSNKTVASNCCSQPPTICCTSRKSKKENEYCPPMNCFNNPCQEALRPRENCQPRSSINTDSICEEKKNSRICNQPKPIFTTEPEQNECIPIMENAQPKYRSTIQSSSDNKPQNCRCTIFPEMNECPDDNKPQNFWRTIDPEMNECPDDNKPQNFRRTIDPEMNECPDDNKPQNCRCTFDPEMNECPDDKNQQNCRCTIFPEMNECPDDNKPQNCRCTFDPEMNECPDDKNQQNCRCTVIPKDDKQQNCRCTVSPKNDKQQNCRCTPDLYGKLRETLSTNTEQIFNDAIENVIQQMQGDVYFFEQHKENNLIQHKSRAPLVKRNTLLEIAYNPKEMVNFTHRSMTPSLDEKWNMESSEINEEKDLVSSISKQEPLSANYHQTMFLPRHPKVLAHSLHKRPRNGFQKHKNKRSIVPDGMTKFHPHLNLKETENCNIQILTNVPRKCKDCQNKKVPISMIENLPKLTSVVTTKSPGKGLKPGTIKFDQELRKSAKANITYHELGSINDVSETMTGNRSYDVTDNLTHNDLKDTAQDSNKQQRQIKKKVAAQKNPKAQSSRINNSNIDPSLPSDNEHTRSIPKTEAHNSKANPKTEQKTDTEKAEKGNNDYQSTISENKTLGSNVDGSIEEKVQSSTFPPKAMNVFQRLYSDSESRAKQSCSKNRCKEYQRTPYGLNTKIVSNCTVHNMLIGSPCLVDSIRFKLKGSRFPNNNTILPENCRTPELSSSLPLKTESKERVLNVRQSRSLNIQKTHGYSSHESKQLKENISLPQGVTLQSRHTQSVLSGAFVSNDNSNTKRNTLPYGANDPNEGKSHAARSKNENQKVMPNETETINTKNSEQVTDLLYSKHRGERDNSKDNFQPLGRSNSLFDITKCVGTEISNVRNDIQSKVCKKLDRSIYVSKTQNVPLLNKPNLKNENRENRGLSNCDSSSTKRSSYNYLKKGSQQQKYCSSSYNESPRGGKQNSADYPCHPSSQTNSLRYQSANIVFQQIKPYRSNETYAPYEVGYEFNDRHLKSTRKSERNRKEHSHRHREFEPHVDYRSDRRHKYLDEQCSPSTKPSQFLLDELECENHSGDHDVSEKDLIKIRNVSSIYILKDKELDESDSDEIPKYPTDDHHESQRFPENNYHDQQSSSNRLNEEMKTLVLTGQECPIHDNNRTYRQYLPEPVTNNQIDSHEKNKGHSSLQQHRVNQVLKTSQDWEPINNFQELERSSVHIDRAYENHLHSEEQNDQEFNPHYRGPGHISAYTPSKTLNFPPTHPKTHKNDTYEYINNMEDDAIPTDKIYYEAQNRRQKIMTHPQHNKMQQPGWPLNSRHLAPYRDPYTNESETSDRHWESKPGLPSRKDTKLLKNLNSIKEDDGALMDKIIDVILKHTSDPYDEANLQFSLELRNHEPLNSAIIRKYGSNIDMIIKHSNDLIPPEPPQPQVKQHNNRLPNPNKVNDSVQRAANLGSPLKRNTKSTLFFDTSSSSAEILGGKESTPEQKNSKRCNCTLLSDSFFPTFDDIPLPDGSESDKTNCTCLCSPHYTLSSSNHKCQ